MDAYSKLGKSNLFILFLKTVHIKIISPQNFKWCNCCVVFVKKTNIWNSKKKKKTFLCDFKFTTCNTHVWLFFTTTNSTVTGAQFCYNNTLEHNTNNTIEHGSSQPPMQKQRGQCGVL